MGWGLAAERKNQRFTLRTVEKTNRLFAGVTIDSMVGSLTRSYQTNECKLFFP